MSEARARRIARRREKRALEARYPEPIPYRVDHMEITRLSVPPVTIHVYRNGRVSYPAWAKPWRHWHKVDPRWGHMILCDWDMPEPRHGGMEQLQDYVLHETPACGFTAWCCNECNGRECCEDHGKGSLRRAHERAMKEWRAAC